jgi:hypothetical protein
MTEAKRFRADPTKYKLGDIRYRWAEAIELLRARPEPSMVEQARTLGERHERMRDDDYSSETLVAERPDLESPEPVGPGRPPKLPYEYIKRRYSKYCRAHAQEPGWKPNTKEFRELLIKAVMPSVDRLNEILFENKT